MSREDVLRDVSSDRIRADVERICREIPHRAAGSPNGKRMAEYSRDALIAAGVSNAEMHELPAIVSFPEHAEFRVESPMQIVIQANTLGHSVATMQEGLAGNLVYVGSGNFADYDGLDVRGKIILTELSYSPARHEKQRIAALKGAIGAVMMNWGPPDNSAVPFGSVKPVWGNPTPENYKDEMPTLPCIGISRAAGLQLKAMCTQAAVRIWLRTHVENGWRPVQITVGEIEVENSPEQGDFVLVGGHQDSWPGEAATDNAAGNACMLELARVFSKYRGKLRRGLMFGFWTAHETGTMAGSAWFADQQWDRLRKHACAYLMIDQPACIGTTTRWAAWSNTELRGFHQAVQRDLLDGRDHYWRRVAKNGDSSFFGVGIPMLQAEGSYTDRELEMSGLATFGWWHHSIENTLDKIDWEWMQVHIGIYAAYLWELCTAPILPFSYRAVAEQIIIRLKELQSDGATVGIESLIVVAAHFVRAAETLDALANTWRGKFIAGTGNEDVARAINTAFKKLSRLLVPLQSTAIGTYGQDSYGFTPQGTMLPCLFDVPQLAKLTDDEARWMLETKLVRNRNRVADALADSVAIIHDLQSWTENVASGRTKAPVAAVDR